MPYTQGQLVAARVMAHTDIDTDQGMNVIKQYGWTEWIETNKALTWDLYCKFSAPV